MNILKLFKYCKYYAWARAYRIILLLSGYVENKFKTNTLKVERMLQNELQIF